MTNQSTIDKLIEMRLTAMADAFRSQLDDQKFKEIPFEDQFGMLVLLCTQGSLLYTDQTLGLRRTHRRGQTTSRARGMR